MNAYAELHALVLRAIDLVVDANDGKKWMKDARAAIAKVPPPTAYSGEMRTTLALETIASLEQLKAIIAEIPPPCLAHAWSSEDEDAQCNQLGCGKTRAQAAVQTFQRREARSVEHLLRTPLETANLRAEKAFMASRSEIEDLTKQLCDLVYPTDLVYPIARGAVLEDRLQLILRVVRDEMRRLSEAFFLSSNLDLKQVVSAVCADWIKATTQRNQLRDQLATEKPIPMLLVCPCCKARHIDEGEFATKSHRDHSCQSCGMTWRPALVPTVGVQFLPGYKNA